MVDTKKQYKRQNDWQKNNADRLSFVMPKGYKDKIKEAASKLDISSAQFVRLAIEEKLSDME